MTTANHSTRGKDREDNRLERLAKIYGALDEAGKQSLYDFAVTARCRGVIPDPLADPEESQDNEQLPGNETRPTQ